MTRCPSCTHFTLRGTYQDRPLGRCVVAVERLHLAARRKGQAMASRTEGCEKYEERKSVA